MDQLTSPIFNDENLKDLVQLRRHLLAKDKVMIKGVEYELSFVDRIKYFD